MEKPKIKKLPIQDGHRLQAGLTSNLPRLARRQRTPEAASLLRSLRKLTPKECQFEAGAACDVAHGMLGTARGSVRTSAETHRRAQRFRSPMKNESVASRLESPEKTISDPSRRGSNWRHAPKAFARDRCKRSRTAMASFSEFVCFCSARTSCDKGDLYAIQPRGQRGSLIKIGYSFNLLRAMSGWEYNDPEKYWHCRRSPDEPAERHSLPEAPRAPAHGGPAAAGATAIRRGEGRIARAVGQGGAVGGHAPPPAFAEPQPRRALPRGGYFDF